jgi:oxygen-dependent protoporphyrinogen oxidase
MTVHVIGAGLSGLATAWYLTERGARVHVREAGPRPGGLIQTLRTPEGLIETAARAFTWSEETGALFEAAGVTPLFARDENRRRYIFRNGRPRRWPLTPVETLGTATRFGSAWVARQVRPRGPESVAVWGRRVFGASATEWLLAPVLQGIYAAPLNQLSASALFGKRRSFRGRRASPLHGMGELITCLHERLRRRGATFEFNRPAVPSDLDSSVPTVICTNAPAAARLLAERAPAFAAAISRIRMVSVVAVTGFFAPHSRDLKGFGVLFPRSSGVGALGTLFNAEIFHGRSMLRSETWIYGDIDAAVLPGTDQAAFDQLARDRALLTGRSDSPIASYVVRLSPALPVYDAAVLRAQAAADALPPNLAVAGNFLGRLGVSSLLTGAADAVERVLAPRGASIKAGPASAEVGRLQLTDGPAAAGPSAAE